MYQFMKSLLKHLFFLFIFANEKLFPRRTGHCVDVFGELSSSCRRRKEKCTRWIAKKAKSKGVVEMKQEISFNVSNNKFQIQISQNIILRRFHLADWQQNLNKKENSRRVKD